MSEEKTYQRPPKRGHGGGRGMMPAEKAKDFKGSIGKLITYIGRYKFPILVVMVFAIIGTVFNVVGPKILGKATTELSRGLMAKIAGTGGIDLTKIGQILIFVLGLYVISAVFTFVQHYIMSTISQKICYRMRKEISEKINRMPMKYFESRTYGEVLSRITNDVDTLGMSLSQSINQIITSVTTMLGVLIMMISISPLLTLIALFILPVSVFLITFVMKKSQRYFRSQQEYLGQINGQVEENFTGHLVIKAYNKEEEVINDFNRTNDHLYDSAWKSQFISGMMQPIMMFVGNLGYAAVALIGGILAIKGTIEIGDIQAFIQYVKNFTQPIQQIAQVANQVQSMAAAAERVFEFLNEEEEDQTVEHPANIEDVVGNVTFEHVNFGYKEDQTIIHDFSAEIKQGQKIAIVGPTGAGKTTMVKLLMRFYDVNSGAIKIDGHNIKDFNRRELRDAFGMVLQDTWLFKGTIMENIRLGKKGATDEELKALKEKAESVLAALDKTPTEDNFKELASKNSADSSTSSKGGLYEDFAKTTAKGYSSELAEWVFAGDRVKGEYKMFEGSKKYYIVYYLSSGEIFWKKSAESNLRSTDTNNWTEKCVEGFKDRTEYDSAKAFEIIG